MTQAQIAKLNETFKNIVEAIDEMKGTMEYINEQWDSLPPEAQDVLCEKYPFDLSFDEMVCEVEAWHEEHKDHKFK